MRRDLAIIIISDHNLEPDTLPPCLNDPAVARGDTGLLPRLTREMAVLVVVARDTARPDLGSTSHAAIPIVVARSVAPGLGAALRVARNVIEAPGLSLGDAC